MADDAYKAGMDVRRSVLGAEHVERATRAATAYDTPFQELITRYAWGSVWGRQDDTLSRRDRSLLTITLLAALGHHEELKMHVRATRNTGVTADEIREALMHVAIYGGVPAANRAYQETKPIIEELLAEQQAGER